MVAMTTATAMRAVVAAARGNPTVGGADDGDCGRWWRLCVMAERCVAGRGRYVVGMAGDGLSRPCRTRARGRYVVGMAGGRLGQAGYGTVLSLPPFPGRVSRCEQGIQWLFANGLTLRINLSGDTNA